MIFSRNAMSKITIYTLIIFSTLLQGQHSAIFADPSIPPSIKKLPPLNAPVNLHISSTNNKIKINFSEVDSLVDYELIRIIKKTSDTLSLGIFSNSPIVINQKENDNLFFLKIRTLKKGRKGNYTELLGTSLIEGRPKILIVNGLDRVQGTNNTFDYILQHGSAVYENGYDFDSASNEAIINGWMDLSNYKIVNWILGEEGVSTNSFDEKEKYLISKYLISGGKIFISGSEIGYDLVQKGSSNDKAFYKEILKSKYITDAAGGRQRVYRIKSNPNSIFNGISFNYDNGSNNSYDVDWPDGILPIDKASSIATFSGLNPLEFGGAGIAFRGMFKNGILPGGLVYLTVGFESIYPDYIRSDIMGRVLTYLDDRFIELNKKNIASNFQEDIGISSFFNNHEDDSITIEFFLNNDKPNTLLSIKNDRGEEIINMKIYQLPVKKQRFRWTGYTKNGSKAESGIYTAILSQGDISTSRKFKLLK